MNKFSATKTRQPSHRLLRPHVVGIWWRCDGSGGSHMLSFDSFEIMAADRRWVDDNGVTGAGREDA